MKTARRRLWALLGLLPACGVDAACPPGERGCSCTEAQGCAFGLQCQANVCVQVISLATTRSNPPATRLLVGAACTDDVECGAALRCLRADAQEFLGAGPAGGYCSLACASDEPCRAADPESVCQPALGLCLRSCRTQDPLSTESKCLRRSNLVCLVPSQLSPSGLVRPAGAQAAQGERQPGVCYPLCASDADCGSGRSCSPGTGLCNNLPAPGKPIGAPCQGDAECAGTICADGACSAPCVARQNDDGCGYPPGAALRDAACVLPLVNVAGDLGVCIELCDSDADCALPEQTCVVNPVAVTKTGRRGACLVP